MLAEKINSPTNRFFSVRVNSILAGRPLAFDIYLFINNAPVLFRHKGEVVTMDRVQQLTQKGAERFWIPEEHRALYLASLKTIIHDPDSSTEVRSRFIKESAFLHVHDLFTKQDVAPVVSEAKNLVEEMVSFISTDVSAVTSLMRLSIHDYYTYNHCVDVAVYSIVLAKKIFGDDKNLLMVAGLGGLLHDIGKRKIEHSIINKSTSLTPQEWDEIRRHPTYGKETLDDIGAIPEPAKRIVYEHHENFDGTGYPRGLKEEDISKLSRVISIADVFDALTTDRSYHKAVTPTEALNTMYSMQPGKFDPLIFKSFNKNFEKKGPLLLPKDFDPCQARLMVSETKLKEEE